MEKIAVATCIECDEASRFELGQSPLCKLHYQEIVADLAEWEYLVAANAKSR